MAVSLVGGAALGPVFDKLLTAVITVARQAVAFKSNLENLRSVLDRIKPIIHDIVKLNEVLEVRKEETDIFVNRLEKGEKLIQKSVKIKRCDFIRKAYYSKKLADLERSIIKFFQLDAQIQLLRDSKKTWLGVNSLNEKMDKVLSLRDYNGLGNGVSGIGGLNPMPFLAGVPGPPDYVVGLDEPLQQTKLMLLNTSVSRVLISGTGGLGKTTLLRLLCNDDQIKDVYGDNIFFVNVSRAGNLELIVRTMLQRLSYQVPEFQSEDDAIIKLELLLRHRGPALIVLDDVWFMPESLLTFKFPLPGSRMLVTSRFDLGGFDHNYKLKPLNDQDALALLCHRAFKSDNRNIPDDVIEKVVKACGGYPIALTVIGSSLGGQSTVTWRSTIQQWSLGQSIFDLNNNPGYTNNVLLGRLSSSLDTLDEKKELKECYLDLGLFPEDQKIAATALLDMWTEMYNLDEDGVQTVGNLHALAKKNLVELGLARQDTEDIVSFCNGLHVWLHDVLRELTVYQSSKDPVQWRRRLMLDIHDNVLPQWFTGQEQRELYARILSVTTDKAFTLKWQDMKFYDVEVLLLNFRTRIYSLPPFIERMSRLKVLIVTNNGVIPAEIDNIQLLGQSLNMKRIRLEHLKIQSFSPSFLQLTNLRKISFVMCDTKNAWDSCDFRMLNFWPNLMEINFDYCNDLIKLPMALCKLSNLRKLSFNYCQELIELHDDLGNLTNLESLRLHSCTKLCKLPESIGNLHRLSLLDISDCIELEVLPIRVGELCSLSKLNMRGCRGLLELPNTVVQLELLAVVISGEETESFWEPFQEYLRNMKINVAKEDINLNWLPRAP